MTEPFDLNKLTWRLLQNEPFFAALSRRIHKVSSTAVPTAGVTIDKETAQFIMLYNPSFFEDLTDVERLGVLKHDTTDYSTGFLPVGPNRSGDTGTQYFTFAFRRQVAANFDINITSAGISGLWIAAPGTGIDSTSGLNGWLRADTAYAGAGVPGSGTGGNGSDGCAFNNSDRIQASTALSGGYTMTLGEENMSNATGNVVLVRIALASGQSVSSLSIAEAVV